MKQNPRRAENGVARELNNTLSNSYNFTPFERVPVIGRTGPDLSLNETGLVIDVKARKTNPKSFKMKAGKIGHTEKFLVCRISDVGILPGHFVDYTTIRPSKMVSDYWEHMDKWTQERNDHKLVSVIALHYTGIPYGCGSLIVAKKDVHRIINNLQRIRR